MRDLLAVTKALSDENRLRIVLALHGRELCLCQIVELLGLATSTVSRHASILQQARLVLSWPLEVRPRWIHCPTRLQSPTARTVLGALISLTPGTLTCDLRQSTLLIHALNAESDRAVTMRIRERFESLLLRMEEV